MKTCFFKCAAIVLIFTVITSGCETSDNDFLPEVEKETDFFYDNNGDKGVISIRKDKVIIKTKSEEDAKTLSSQTVFHSAYNVGFWVFATINPSKTNLDALMKLSVVVDATYGLETEDGTLQYPSDKIFLKCKDGETPENTFEANGLAENVETIELFDQFSGIFEISLNVKLSDILKTCRILYESGMCKFAEPSFFREMHIHVNYSLMLRSH